MPKIPCSICKRWTFKEGCSLEQRQYWKFRDCMMDRKDWSIPIDMEQEQPCKEGSADD